MFWAARCRDSNTGTEQLPSEMRHRFDTFTAHALSGTCVFDGVWFGGVDIETARDGRFRFGEHGNFVFSLSSLLFLQ